MTCKPRSILVVTPFAHYPSHSWPVSEALARALIDKGLDVRIVACAQPALTVADDLAGRLEVVSPPLNWFLKTLRFTPWRHRRLASLVHNLETLVCLFRATTLCGRQRFDVVHLVDGTFLPVFLWSWLFRLPTVYSLWGPPDNLTHPTLSHSLRSGVSAAARFALAKALAGNRLAFVCETTQLLAQWRPILGDSIEHIPYALASRQDDQADRSEARRRIGVPEDALVLLLFGTHRRGKDYRVVLEAAQRATERPFLLFAGKVISDNDPRQLAAQAGYERVVVRDEFIPEQEVPSYFAAADAVVLPYEAGYAKGSGVLLEACRFGRPVIATRTPHLSQFVEAYGTGFLFDAGDAAELARLIDRLHKLSEAERRFLEVGIRRAVTDHSWPVAAGRLLSVYGRVLEPDPVA